ncbi:STYXL1 [Branchiostoma lanceolatum]|uniref:STYXL1 protein n=1 Tax=Branchiostoma lanceolatum TaxID=7740 RepID=A0A8J9VZ31_BRALA|nr:STYXL1 [Branchiostoma lanceolatum]
MPLSAGLVLCEPTELYNILNQSTAYPCLSDPNYLLLLDARSSEDYAVSHVLTSKKAWLKNGEYLVPYDSEIECKTHCVVYDSHTRSLKDKGDAIACATVLANSGSKNPVKVLRGGYEDFSALYPFLRTQKIIYMPRELDDLMVWPCEVLPGLLYVANYEQACTAVILKELKCKGYINVSTEPDPSFPGRQNPEVLRIVAEDSPDTDLLSHFEEACAFIDKQKKLEHAVLVFDTRGNSRNICIALAYLMHLYKWPLKDAYKHMLGCKHNISPNMGFIKQLGQWEEKLIGADVTNMSERNCHTWMR